MAVLDEGGVVELGRPAQLKERPESVFAAMLRREAAAVEQQRRRGPPPSDSTE